MGLGADMIQVLDIQSDWQTTQEESFWVSSTERKVLMHPKPTEEAELLNAATFGKTKMHNVLKEETTFSATNDFPYYISSQSRYKMTIADRIGMISMPFYTPHSSTNLNEQLYTVQSSPNENFLGVGGANGLFNVIQVPSQQSIRLSGHLSDVTHVNFFPSSLVALTGSTDFLLRIWSLQSFSCGAVLTGHRGAIQGIGILGRGRNVVSCARDHLVKIWNCASGTSFREWKLDAHPSCLAIMADYTTNPGGIDQNELEFETVGKWFLVGTENGCIGLDARVATPVLDLSTNAPVSACKAIASEASHMILVGTENGSILTYDIRQSSIPMHMVSRSSAAVKSIECSSNGSAWISTGDGACSKWENLWTIPTISAELLGPVYDSVNDVCVTKQNVYSVSRDGMLRTYNIE